ncbi:hypothetical protein [Lysobacter sp. Root916]|uniref:hypothetical protein n=1 Tax=Lysobacter sp. Root916 TaxID=1736606 RepID=UPI00070C8D9A|nr:hypothetical protein [Lysobacter sp. Root916]
MAIIEKLKEWRRGRYIPPPPSDPSNQIFFLSLGRYEQPVLAKLLGALGRFYLAHWQWIISTALAVIAIIVAS